MILVVGSTGLLGGMITRKLLAEGHAVRILQRDAPDYQALINQGAQPVRGDLRDRASLDAACAGVDVVLTTAIARFTDGGTFESVDLNGTRSLIDAAAAAGVGQLVYTSAYGSAKDSPNPLMSAKAHVEEYLQASGLRYTILQPAVFMEVWINAVIGVPLQAGQPVTLVGEGSHKHHFVSVPDVAEIAVKTIGNPAAMNQAIPIGADRATWTEIVDMVQQAMGRPVARQYVPIGTPLPLLPDVVSGLMWAMETYDSYLDMGHWPDTLRVRPTSVHEFITRTFS